MVQQYDDMLAPRGQSLGAEVDADVSQSRRACTERGAWRRLRMRHVAVSPMGRLNLRHLLCMCATNCDMHNCISIACAASNRVSPKQGLVGRAQLNLGALKFPCPRLRLAPPQVSMPPTPHVVNLTMPSGGGVQWLAFADDIDISHESSR